MSERDIRQRPWVPEEQVLQRPYENSSGVIPVVVTLWSQPMRPVGIGRPGVIIKEESSRVEVFVAGWRRLIEARACDDDQVALATGMKNDLVKAGVLRGVWPPEQNSQAEVTEVA